MIHFFVVHVIRAALHTFFTQGALHTTDDRCLGKGAGSGPLGCKLWEADVCELLQLLQRFHGRFALDLQSNLGITGPLMSQPGPQRCRVVE